MDKSIKRLRASLEEKSKREAILAQLNKVSQRLDELSQVKTWHELEKARKAEKALAQARADFDMRGYVRRQVR
jgi:Xaa-Pro aminopeptidase